MGFGEVPVYLEAKQRTVCEQHGAQFVAAPAHSKVGISENVRHAWYR